MKKREPLNSKRVTSSSLLSSKKTFLSSAASTNVSSGSFSKDPQEVDLEVEIDIYYSQYLHSKLMEKIMIENKTVIENSIKGHFATVLDEKAGLQNPKVTLMKNFTQEVKQLGTEYSKLYDLKNQLENLENQN